MRQCFEHGFVGSLQLLREPLSDGIFAPVGRTAAEAGKIEIANRSHIGMHEVAVTSKRGFVAELMIPVSIHVQHGTLEAPDNLKKFNRALVADIARNDQRI